MSVGPADPLTVMVIAAPELASYAERVRHVVRELEDALAWRYDERLVTLADDYSEEFLDASMTDLQAELDFTEDTATSIPVPSDLTDRVELKVDLVLGLVWTTLPGELRIILPDAWPPYLGELHVLACDRTYRLQRPEEAHELATALTFLQAAPPDRMWHFGSVKTFDARVRQVVSTVARRRWLESKGMAQVVCPVCRHSVSTDGGRGTCPNDGSTLLFPRHGRGRDLQVDGALKHGRYPLCGRIGDGGFGDLYFSIDAGNGRPVAVKVLRTDHPEHTRRFHREVELLISLNHRNVVQVLDRFEEGGKPVYVMEYLSGRTLEDVLTRLPAPALLSCVDDLLAGLAFIHERGVIHRDLKPANVFVADDATRPGDRPRVVLLDFGLGKNIESERTPLTKMGKGMGTFKYMAPEQFAAAATADARADLYSVGVILYMGLTGEAPFAFEGGMKQLVANYDHMQRTPAPAITDAGVSPALRALVARALAKDPGDRFASAREMRDALLALG